MFAINRLWRVPKAWNIVYNHSCLNCLLITISMRVFKVCLHWIFSIYFFSFIISSSFYFFQFFQLFLFFLLTFSYAFVGQIQIKKHFHLIFHSILYIAISFAFLNCSAKYFTNYELAHDWISTVTAPKQRVLKPFKPISLRFSTESLCFPNLFDGLCYWAFKMKERMPYY